MNSVNVYDTTTRLLHWVFAGLFVSAFFIAKTVDDESTVFAYHALLGLSLVFTVLIRIVWGVLGTKSARFTSYNLNPADLFDYMKGIITSRGKKYFTHNPASSWAAVFMFGLTLGLGFTGWQMSIGHESDWLEELHEIFANLFLITVLLHVMGVMLHTVKYKELIGLSMITGKRTSEISNNQSVKNNPVLATGVLIMILSFFFYTIKNYNPLNGELLFMGQKLTIGESEGEGAGEESEDELVNENGAVKEQFETEDED